MRKFLKSKIRVEYPTGEITPWYKGLWYYATEKNTNVLVVIPLNIPLVILRNIYYGFRLFGLDSLRWYNHQFKLRKVRHERERSFYRWTN